MVIQHIRRHSFKNILVVRKIVSKLTFSTQVHLNQVIWCSFAIFKMLVGLTRGNQWHVYLNYSSFSPLLLQQSTLLSSILYCNVVQMLFGLIITFLPFSCFVSHEVSSVQVLAISYQGWGQFELRAVNSRSKLKFQFNNWKLTSIFNDFPTSRTDLFQKLFDFL